MSDSSSMAVDETDTMPLSTSAADSTSPMTVDDNDAAASSHSSAAVTALPDSVAHCQAEDTHDPQQQFASESTLSSIDPQPTSHSSASASSTPAPPSSDPAAADSSYNPNATRRPPAEDDCCVCFNGESEENDPILFCDGPGCTAVVHQSCYGVMAIPDGDWLCDSCAIKANPTLAADTPLLLKTLNRCMLCPDATGAFKPTADGRGWVHASCAIWTPETGFHDAEKVDSVIGIETIDRRRWRLVCEICRIKQGSCVQCMGRQCSFSCHVTCGWKAGLRMEMQAVGAGEELEVYKLVYCGKHRNEPWQKASGRWGRGRPRAVRPNDDNDSNGSGNGRGDSATSGYQCVRCGSRRRRHECKREDVDELVEDENDEVEEDQELLRLWEDRNERETLEERMEREEEEREMDRLWETERQSLERETEQKRRQDRERREKEREERLARGEVTLYEELRQAQEEAEEKYAMGDGLDKERPASTTKRRKRRDVSSGGTAADGEWKQGKEEAKEAEGSADEDVVVKPRRIGRPAGSLTRVRKCIHHRAMKERCGRDCPFRPPPFTEAELKARAAERALRAKGGKREVRRKMEDAMRMSTSAPGQRKVIREEINVQLGSGLPQQEKKEAPTPPPASSAPSLGSPSVASVPLSSLNSLPPPPFAHPVAPSAIVSNPIAAPPAPVLPPLATSAALVVARPNAPYLYNARDGAELSRRVQSLLTASTPDQQRLQLKQLLSDSPPPYSRLVTQRLQQQKVEAVLLLWLREGREHKAWALIQEVLSALTRIVTAQWDEKVAAGVIQEVLIHREGVSEGCKKEANAVWKRLVEIGWVKEANKAELKTRDAFIMALQAGQLNGVLAGSAAVNGSTNATERKAKVVKLPAFTNGENNSSSSTQSTARSPATPSTAASRQPKHGHGTRAVVGMTSERYRQRAMQEEAEKRLKEAERKKEREYQAGLAAQSYPLLPPQPLHPQQQSYLNGGWNGAQSHMQHAVVDPMAALGALTGQLFAGGTLVPLVSSPSPSLPAAGQSQVADALQAAAMLQAQLQQRVGGSGAFANLQALDEMLRNGGLHASR